MLVLYPSSLGLHLEVIWGGSKQKQYFMLCENNLSVSVSILSFFETQS